MTVPPRYRLSEAEKDALLVEQAALIERLAARIAELEGEYPEIRVRAGWSCPGSVDGLGLAADRDPLGLQVRLGSVGRRTCHRRRRAPCGSDAAGRHRPELAGTDDAAAKRNSRPPIRRAPGPWCGSGMRPGSRS